MESKSLIRFKTANPRRNLPSHLYKKRGESNFVAAFERHFISTQNAKGVGGRYFEINGYGIADFLWVERRPKRKSVSSGVPPADALLSAFEIKMRNWKRALTQAHRYSYFADKATVVLPPASAIPAIANIDLFRRLRIALWTFDSGTRTIEKIYEPRYHKPRSMAAKNKAVELLRRKIKFRDLCE